MIGADGENLAEAEAVEFEGVFAARIVIGLVSGHDDRAPGAVLAQHLRDVLVCGGDALFAVNDHENDVRIIGGQHRLALNLRDEIDAAFSQRPRIAAAAGLPNLNAACVDDVKGHGSPLALSLDAVACGARNVIDDGHAAPDQAIEQRAFAGVGTPDERNKRFGCHEFLVYPCAAQFQQNGPSLSSAVCALRRRFAGVGLGCANSNIDL